jgi:hypothetical protein
MAVTGGKMIAKLWKRFYGNSGQELLGEMFLLIFALGRQPIIVLIAGP